MLQALIINIKLSVPLGISSYDSTFCFSADNKRTNRTNLAMNEQNNQTQIDLWNQQKEYDYEMWNKENDYNTPANQVKRLQEAGINPALALSQISSGSATSSAGGQTPPTTTPGHVEPNWQEMMAKVQNIALIGKTFSDINKQLAEAQGIQKQNFWIDANNAANLSKSNSEVGRNIADTVGKNIENRFQSETYDERVGQLNTLGETLIHQRNKASADSMISEYTKQHMQNVVDDQDPQVLNNLKAAYSEAISRVAKNYSDIEVNNANIEKVGAEVNKLVKESEILGKNSKLLNDQLYISNNTAGSMVRKLKAESAGSEFDNSGIGKAINLLLQIGQLIK